MNGDDDKVAMFLIGLAFGAALVILCMWLGGTFPTGSKGACRAASPGYECRVGWVKGEAFK